METLFDPVSYREVLRRVESIQSDSRREWGKMTVAQNAGTCGACA
jgi:hypothetical protein